MPVSEALRYFSLFSSHTDVDKLEEENKELQKQLAEKNNKLKPIDDQREKTSNDIELSNKSLDDLNVEIKNIESSIKEKNILIEKLNTFFSEDTINLLKEHPAELINSNLKKRDKHREELNKLISDLKVKDKEKENLTLKIQHLNNSLYIINSDKTIEDVAIEALKTKINSNKKHIDELSQPEDGMLVSIHGWDNDQMEAMIKTVLNDQYPVNFMAVNKLCKHINMANELKVANKDFLNLKSLALETKNTDSVIKETAESLLPSL